jgi:hypothetical protein
VVDALAAAAGVLYVPHRLVVMPNDPRLGQFQGDFAGVVGTIEESPRLEAPTTPGFEGFERDVNGDDFDELLDADPSERVDARAFLKARLLDLLIGDYDRHVDQWSWVKSESTGRWVPVPRDRDLAFVRFGGLIMRIVRTQQQRLVEFESEYPSLVGLTWQARFLDRRYLSELEWPAWQETVTELTGLLTDAAIDDAVRRLPGPYFEAEGATLARRLKSRRDALPKYARRYYGLLAREAEVHGSDLADAVQLSYRHGAVDVAVSGPKGEYFRRTYHAGETREVRVDLKDGDDRVRSESGDGGEIEVRVIGGDGDDSLDDRAGGRVRFYDVSGANSVAEGPGTRTSERPYKRPEDRNGSPVRDWGSRTGILPWLQVGGDYGVLAGVALVRTSYAFRKDPNASQQGLQVGYSTRQRAPFVQYGAEWRLEQSPSRFALLVSMSPLDVVHFYGFGNETPGGPTEAFHDVDRERYMVAPCFRYRNAFFGMDVGPILKYGETNLDRSTLVALRQPYGVGRFGQAGWRVGIGTGRQDDAMVHAFSAALRGDGVYYPALWSVDDAFGVVRGELTAVAQSGLPLRPALAVRAGAQRNFGPYPFHEAAAIGGLDSVRGLPRQRYIGDAALAGSVELRLLLRERDDSLVTRFGVFGLADAGRVSLDGDSSGRWHTALGGGLWFSVVEPKYLVTLTAATSESNLRFYLQGGFAF